MAALEFAHPWLLLLVLLPLPLYWLPPYRESSDAVRAPFYRQLIAISGDSPTKGAVVQQRRASQYFLVGLMWLALVLSAAKPQWIGAAIEQQKSGRDLMVAVDLSGSMATSDFTLPSGELVDRLAAVKYVLQELASQRESDRLGMLVFATAAYLQTPFTDDHEIWQQLLLETEIGMAGQSTVFGDAIGLAIKQFLESDSDQRVLIVLTDGNDTGSMVPPVDAAKVALAHNIRIYTIAIGDPAGVGEEALDIATIERVSEITGGQSFQALDRQALEQAYRTIGELEPAVYENISYRPRTSLHYLPIALVALLFTLYHCLQAGRRWRRRGGLKKNV